MSSEIPNNDRSKAISAIYRELLERDADGPGMATYYSSSLDLEEIRRDIANSRERVLLLKKKGAIGDEIEVGAEKFLMGLCPRNEGEVNRILSEGGEIIMNIGPSENVPYDKGAFLDYKFLPLIIAPDGPFDYKSLGRCLGYLHENVVKRSRKVYIHPTGGNLVSCLILSAVFTSFIEGISVISALYRLIVTNSNLSMKPEAFTSDVVKVLMDFEKSVGRKKRFTTNVCANEVKEECRCGKTVNSSCSSVPLPKIEPSLVAKLCDGVFCGDFPGVHHLAALRVANISKLISTHKHNQYTEEFSSFKTLLLCIEKELSEDTIKSLREEVLSESVYIHGWKHEYAVVVACFLAVCFATSSLETATEAVKNYFGDECMSKCMSNGMLELGLRALSL